MNSIEGLKKFLSIVERLRDDMDNVQSQIDACYRPFRDIIVEVFLHSKEWGNGLYLDDTDIGVSDNDVSFVIRWRCDDEVESSHCFPIEAFVSAQTLSQFMCDRNEAEAKAKIAKEEHNKRYAEKALEESERANYEKLKKKFEGA